MMANWNLENLGKEFPKLEPELHLIACENDQTISINESRRVHKWMVNSFLHEIPALGHLGHEEEPATFAKLILEIAEKHKLTK
jgi:magnesium chelatase accessory protein